MRVILVLTVCLCFLSGCTDNGGKTNTKDANPTPNSGKAGSPREPGAPPKD